MSNNKSKFSLIPEFELFFSGYGAYHHNPVNKIIHIFCIPLILISLVQLMQHGTFRVETPLVDITLPLIFVLILSFVYVQVDTISGLISTSIYLTTTLVGTYIFKSLKSEQAVNSHFNYMLGLHIFAWISQFIGHGFFEKRKPALADNIFQVFVAPNFVIIELLFLLGYKPEIKNKCDQRISDSVAAFRKQAQKKNI